MVNAITGLVESVQSTGFLVHISNRDMNATKSYLHFGRFGGNTILRSNFFCFFIVFGVVFFPR